MEVGSRRGGVDGWIELDFLADLFYPSQVRIGARALGVGTSSFTIGTAVFDGDLCVSRARSVMVHLGDDKRSAPVPDALRKVLLAEIG